VYVKHLDDDDLKIWAHDMAKLDGVELLETTH